MNDATQDWKQQRNQRLMGRLRSIDERLPKTRDYKVEGLLKRVVGLTLEASGCRIPIGGRCAVETAHGEELARLRRYVASFAGSLAAPDPERVAKTRARIRERLEGFRPRLDGYGGPERDALAAEFAELWGVGQPA